MKESWSNPAGKTRMLKPALATVVGLAALVVTGVLTVVWIVSRDVSPGTELGEPLHPLKLETPFTMRRGSARQIAEAFMLPIYPGAAAREVTVSKWLEIPDTAPKKGAGLSVLRLHAQASFAQLDQWYQQRLGPDFTRVEAQRVVAEWSREEWVRRLQSDFGGGTLLFQHRQAGLLRGVLLQPKAGGSVLITLFHYFGGPSE